jgi:hypothetical protein
MYRELKVFETICDRCSTKVNQTEEKYQLPPGWRTLDLPHQIVDVCANCYAAHQRKMSEDRIKATQQTEYMNARVMG